VKTSCVDVVEGSSAGVFFHQLHGSCAVIVLDADLSAYDDHYGLRGYRYALIEAGHVGQELLRRAALVNLSACPVGAFWDEGLRRQLGLDFTARAPLYCVAVGHAG
jgi:nitroreductase